MEFVDRDILGGGFIERFERCYPARILNTLLCDRTTGRNIIWADNEYEALGDGYAGSDEITADKITGLSSGAIKPRIAKEQERQSRRTKSRAEVFTPSWLCNQMNNDIDSVWFGCRNVFNNEEAMAWRLNPEVIRFPKGKGLGWHAYVESPRLEITCGEAPFVCSRYDTVTGDVLPVSERIGFLDRKLRVVSEKTKTRKEWVRRALIALSASYGFEYQGDNLLIARINVFETFCEHHRDRWGSAPTDEEIDRAAWIVSWNFWQMNGLTEAVPTNSLDATVESTLGSFEEPVPTPVQPSLFDMFDDFCIDDATNEAEKDEPTETVPLCVIYDWRNNEPFEFAALKGEACPMEKKFFAVVGNPPYQELDGGNEASATPIYHLFVQESAKIADKVCVVTPSRWFAGGKGLNNYRKWMLNGGHLRYLVDFHKLYEPFPNVKIRGGVSYFVFDNQYNGPCTVQNMEDGKPVGQPMTRDLNTYDVLIRMNDAVSILEKVQSKEESNLGERVSSRKPFGFPTNYHGASEEKGISNAVMLYESQRTGWIERDAITQNDAWVDKWKVLVTRVQGTSAAVETKFLSNPIIAAPGTACTETYLVAGLFDNEFEAINYRAYLCTRFARFLISLRKVTQDSARQVYSFVPDLKYDHAWTDEELFSRYGITDTEIAYIKSVVKEMD